MAITLRAATKADVPVILHLVRALADYEKLLHEVVATETDFRDRLFGANPMAHAVLAEADGAAVGLALYYYTFSTFIGRGDLFLEDLFVIPSHRGHGVGLALFRHLACIARDRGARRIEWRVLDWNRPALDFYARIGARPMTEWSVQRLEGAALAALAG